MKTTLKIFVFAHKIRMYAMIHLSYAESKPSFDVMAIMLNASGKATLNCFNKKRGIYSTWIIILATLSQMGEDCTGTYWPWFAMTTVTKFFVNLFRYAINDYTVYTCIIVTVTGTSIHYRFHKYLIV